MIGASSASVASKQLVALSSPLVGKRVATRDEPFAGVVRVGDLGEVRLVEQR